MRKNDTGWLPGWFADLSSKLHKAGIVRQSPENKGEGNILSENPVTTSHSFYHCLQTHSIYSPLPILSLCTYSFFSELTQSQNHLVFKNHKSDKLTV